MRGDRPADLKYLIQLAQAAEINGFEAVLTPTGLWCEDAWLTTAMLIGNTETLKYLVAFRPGLISPTLAAQMSATFQWQSQGRLLLNVVTRGEGSEQRALGGFPGEAGPLRPLRRVSRHRSPTVDLRHPGDCRRRTPSSRAGHPRSPSGPASRRVLRRFLTGSGRCRRPLSRHLSDLGRAPRTGQRKTRLDSRSGRRTGPPADVRHPATRHLPRHQRAGVGGG